MKTLFKTLVLIAITSFIVSCKSSLQTQNSFDDDVYGKKGGAVQANSDQSTRSNRPVEPTKTYTETDNSSGQDQVNNYTTPDNRSSETSYDSEANNNNYQNNSTYDPNNSNSQSYTDGNGNTYVTNNYYDDYYDYEYASRLRRFNDYNMGYGYYDDYYTNSYWYNYDPYFWGVSIYTGYNWW